MSHLEKIKTALGGALATTVALGVLAFAAPAAAQDAIPDQAEAVAALGGDAAAGEKVFRKCKACHVVDEEKNRVGPHLMHIFGRPAAAVEGFKYSKANAESGVVWTVETLTPYLAKPRDFMKGTKMAFPGLKKEEDIANVLTYLFEAGGGVYEGATN